jgi:hypothetical protein
VQRVHVTVTQPLHGQFIVHSDREPIHFTDLAGAISKAQSIAVDKARKLAHEAGAQSVEVRLSSTDRQVQHDVDGDLFLETRITAAASGRPDVRRMNHD